MELLVFYPSDTRPKKRHFDGPISEADRLSDTERAMLMGGACAKAYGWSPKKG